MTRHSAVKKPRASKSARGISSKIEKCRIKKLELKLEKMRLDAKCLELQIKLKQLKCQDDMEVVEPNNCQYQPQSNKQQEEEHSVDSSTDYDSDTDDSDTDESDTDESDTDESDESDTETSNSEVSPSSNHNVSVLAAGAGTDSDTDPDNSSDEDYIVDTDEEEPINCQQRISSRKRKAVDHFIDQQQSYFEGEYHGRNDKWDTSYNGHFSCSDCGQLYNRKETRECGCDIIHWKYGPNEDELAEERIEDRKHSRSSSKSKSAGYIKDGFIV